MGCFRDQIKKRIKWIILFAFCYGIVTVAAFLLKFQNSFHLETGLPVEVLVASLSAVLLTAAFRVQRYQKALKSEEALEALHINETDERYRIIVFQTSRTCLNILLTSLGIAGIIIPFFSWTIFYTVAGILIMILIIYTLVFSYYMKKY